MSSSSDIEKLFDHFGGDANAYQEIGRENEARSARTRWPLLVTLDLTQPAIPAIVQRRAVAGEAVAQTVAPADDRQDTTPKDTASVTRAKAPLFTRSHRRDIPPVVLAAQEAAPRGASRFGAPETNDHAAEQTAPAAARIDAVTSRVEIPAVTPRAIATAAVPAPAPSPVFATAPAAVSAPASAPVFAPAATPVSAPAWTQAAAPATWASARAPAPTYTTAPATPKPPASILGKLFAPEPALVPPQQPAAPTSESAPLQSVFDRLRGTPAQTAAAPAVAPRAATPAASNSWLVNGPRRS
ncbi:cellulose biosynthesis protein BcsP [Paraburkholderia sp. BL23I1N1]|uniref:cellulose biosynthesis protein BcsP n=1 Tax=Paraburkholderia sp. BL23I1N1 TaxID=1938802 RepID=UPI000E771F8B|nr:cellulose biosynthesis protein BcsP [Paraburkholderia sp. BL23I1N1]